MKVRELILSIDMEPDSFARFNYDNCDSDVIAIVEKEDQNGEIQEEKYVASFFTFKNIQSLAKRLKSNNDFLGGKYFWAEGMVLIDRLNLTDVEKVVSDIIDEGDFNTVFRKI